jgi:hypothetical protein
MSTEELLDTSPNRYAERPASRRPNPTGEKFGQAMVLTMLFAFPAILCVRAACVADPDIWWHMRVGEWILQHHAAPNVESYSRELTGTPWLGYSWLFELLAIKVFRAFGVLGIVGYSAAMVLSIVAAVRHLVQRLQSDFTVTVFITFVACFSLARLYTPRPWLFSILFFVLELDILMHARRTGRLRELMWLPLIFALWANIHIEFIYGLFIVGVAFVESVACRFQKNSGTAIPIFPIGCALLASALATLVNPFGWRVYSVVYNLATQGGGLNVVSEMQAIPFRSLTDFCILFLALASAASLAWARRFRWFEVGLLFFALVMSFRSQRDAWVICMTAAAILASVIPGRQTNLRLPKFATALATAAAALLVLASFRVLHVNKATLDAQVANILPVHAVEEVRQKGYSGPVFNDFNWGGYLIWALREPVAIDGRTNLYGNARMDRSIATWNAQPDWNSDKLLTSAGVVIGPVTSPLTQVLRLDSRFQLVYQDKVAAVFIAHKNH